MVALKSNCTKIIYVGLSLSTPINGATSRAQKSSYLRRHQRPFMKGPWEMHVHGPRTVRRRTVVPRLGPGPACDGLAPFSAHTLK